MLHPLSILTSATMRTFATIVVLAATLIVVPGSVTPAGAQSVCPAGTTLGTTSWGSAGGMVWTNDATTSLSGASQTFANIAGGVDLIVSYTDLDNVNEDLDNPYLNFVTGDSWDAPVYTQTDGTYGADFFTIVMNSLNSDQTVDWQFDFSKPVFVPDFAVSDIDWAGYGYSNGGAGTPHESFQDEVVLAGQRGGNAIAFAATGGSGIQDLGNGRLVAGPYTAGVNGNVGPTDAAGTAALAPVGPVTSFNMQYSNGPADATADAADATPPAPIPANSPGVSNNHAVAINNFTVCAGNLELGDTVWADVDGDGVQDPNEPGVAGVTVSIADLEGNVVETQVTGADGSYLFDSFPGFDWVVSIDVPTGYTSTFDRDGGDLASTTINPTTSEYDIDFGLQPDPGTISGTVLADRNNNGSLDASSSDSPLPGVTVTLQGTDVSGATVTQTTTTGADGSYTFTDVDAGTYTVTETQPTGFIDGIDTPGTLAVADGNDQHEVTLTPLDSSTGNDFAEVPTSSIAGNVYRDDDNDGALDSAEPGIGGVSILVEGTDVFGNTISLTTTTLPDGSYLVPLLISGTYTVTETQPTTFADGIDTPGSNGGTVGADEITAIPLGFEDDATDYNFGELPVSSLAGSVTDDDGNPIENVTITLTGTDDVGASVLSTTTTAADGTYSFSDLRPGTYTITETQPTAYGDGPDSTGTVDGSVNGSVANDQISNIVLGVDDDGVDYDFTETRGSIAGSVTDDNGNGIPGTTITLTGTDALGASVSLTTTTAADGSYSFENLLGGTYSVTETQPVGYGDGADSAGTAGGSVANDIISAISPGGGVDATGYDFAETTGSLSGQVFLDPENDGLFGSTGTGEPGVTITLTGTDDLGNAVSLTTTTAGDGTYQFDDLISGTYSIAETQPSDLVDGIDTVGTAGAASVSNDVFNDITLTGGTDGTGYDFAELSPAGVSGSVVDSNGDPIAGVTITLTGTDDFGASVSINTTTGSDGSYVFFDLAPGTYTVSETQPSGYGDGPDSVGTTGGSANGTLGDDEISNIVLGPDDVGIDYDFTESFGSIAGSVVDDGGTGIAGVAITLTGTDSLGGAVSLATATGADGSYLFDDLLGGTYTVTETQPTAYGDGVEAVGTINGTAVGDASIDDVISGIVLADGESGVDYDFNEVRGSIRGLVYEDLDNSGTRQPIEPAIGGVTVTLSGTDILGNTVNETTTTNASGAYQFNGLLAGTYAVTETQPAGYADGIDRAGANGGDISVNDVISGVTIVGGQIANGYIFGEIQLSSIAGTVFDDNNDNGTQDTGEDGIGSVTVTLTGTDDLGATVSLTTTTAAGGTYSFDDLRPGTYTVTETQPSGFLDGQDTVGSEGGDNSANDVISSIVLGTNTDATGYDFAEIEGASIAGSVVDDGGNPIPGVTITLNGTDDLGATISLTTTTASDGSYSFDGLRPGTYAVTETQPSAYGDGGETAGTAGGDDSVNDTITGIVLGSEESATGYDFDETRSSLAGTVYEDTNNNGTQDGLEPGIGGVSIRLTGIDAFGAVVDLTTTTAADGSYSFGSLIGGTYQVIESQPTGYLDGSESPGSAGGSSTTNDRITAVDLTNGIDATDYDFGELLPSSIAGAVVDDLGDPITSVTITLTGTDDLGNTVTTTTTTGADGTYSFDDLRPGTYTVTESQPTGFLDGVDSVGTSGGDNSINDVISAITLPSDTDATDYDFAEVRASSIAGSVADDGGNPITGVTITLTGTDDLGATVSETTTTGADGSYSFENLRPGTYTVTETQPAAYGDGGETAGTAGGDDSVNDTITSIALPARTDATGYDFDETRGSITGTVYEDTNNNGTQDGLESGIGGVIVELTGADILGDTISLSTTTAADGSYSFGDLLAGTYTVTETQPSSFLDGQDTTGTSGGDNSVNDETSAINLTGGTDATSYDFGELLPSSIAGSVRDDAGAGISGASITLTGTDELGNAISLTTTTSVEGSYSFDDLRPGTYTVTETQPSGFLDGTDTIGSEGGDNSANDVISAINLTSDTDATGYDFDEVRASSIAGSVADDGGNPIAGVTITLTGTDDLGATVSLTTTTAADGTYTFDDLRPGTYTATETQPMAYGDGGETAGTSGGVVSNDVISAIALAANTTATGYDFDETRGSIAGTVYEDLDADGSRDGAEPGIGSVTVDLTGTNVLGDTISLSTTTAADGSYSFGDLLAGTYTVTETQPSSFLDGQDSVGTSGGDNTTNDTTSSIVMTGGVEATGYDFGEVQAASIAGIVFIDSDNSGTQNGVETGIAGVTVTLTGTDDLGNTVTTTTTTGTDGSYSFNGLRPGTYTVTETQAVGYSDGIDAVGTAGGSLANDAVSAIALASGEDATGYTFGELEGASITGSVLDDAGSPIAGTTITLTGTDDLGNTVTTTTTTGTDGSYGFNGLRPGTYTVTETQPTGYGDGGETTGTSGGTVADDQISAITLASGQVASGYDFDEARSSLSGVVYRDADGNGTFNAGDTGLGGITIELTGTDDLGNAVTATTTTGADGSYSFTGLLSGTYDVTEPTQPAGLVDGIEVAGTSGGTAGNTPATNDTITSIALAAGTDATGYLFGEWDASAVGGTVTDELGRPISGVTLTLTGTDDDGDTVNVSVTTGPDGVYTFTGLEPGTYTITESQPAAYGDGGDSAGSLGGVVTDDQIATIAVGPGEVGSGYDFVETLGAITGTVFVDNDGNGTLGATELGIDGVTLELSGTDANGQAVAATTTTNPDGTYSFDGLVGGTYTVTQLQPAGFLDGGETVGSAGGSTSVNDVISAISTTGGIDATGYDFGEIDAASVSGSVTDDGGNPIVGATITLTGTDDLGATVTLTDTTDATGVYSFDGLRPGTYTVTETQPVGYGDGGESAGPIGGTVTDDQISGIVLGSDTDATDNNFTETRSTLSGQVFEDLDSNGTRNGTEPGIAGVEVTLTGTDVLGAPVSATTTTSGTGDFEFAGLLTGTYTITETQPAGYADGDETVGTAGGDGSTQNDQVSAIPVGAGTTNTGYLFGEVEPVSISGTVFNDANNDGVNAGTEAGIDNVTITLSGIDDRGQTVTLTTQTASDGSYSFDGLRPGTYTVTETQPTGLLDGIDTVGTVAGASQGVLGPDQVTTITLASGDTAIGYDFGELTPASVAGSVADDLGNPLAGVSITLTGTDDLGNSVTTTVTTASDGSYSFDGLRPGTYTITETQPTGYGDGGETAGTAGGSVSDDVISGVMLTAGETATGYDFDETTAAISGSVFVDADGNTVPSTGDTDLVGVELTLSGTEVTGGPVSATTTTGADGSYSFDGLLAGTYTVTETQPTGYGDGIDTAGTSGGSADNTAGGDAISGITLVAGIDATGNDFSEVEAASLSGSVVDNGGAAIPNVTITLTGTDLFGDPVSTTTTTTTDGSYSFDGLAPGTYTVTETQPIGYGDGGETAGTNGGTVSDDVIADITLGSGDTASGYDFDDTRSSLSGTIAIDGNGNGDVDGGETPIAGVTVTLTGTDVLGGAVSTSTTTGADGSYRFGDLLAGTYTVTETQPAGFLDGGESAGSAGGSVSNDAITGITTLAGVDATGYDFVELEASSITGGVSDDMGRPIAGVTITLTGTDDLGAPVSLTTTTATDGGYTFDGLRPGTYTITETQPAGYGDSSDHLGTSGGDNTINDVVSGIVLTSGTDASGYDFDEVTGSIAGATTFVTGAGESPISGVTIQLTGTDANGDPVDRTTTTAADGTFVFDGLVGGNYTLTETQPEAFVDGADRVGTAGGDNTISDVITGIVLPGGTVADGYVFTETGTVVTGTVWLDLDGDGNADPLDGIDLGGVVIELIGPEGTVVATTTTNTDGTYVIGGITAGDYTVRQTQPEEWGSTTPNEVSISVPTTGLSGVDFGEQAGSISGTVFADDDGNGLDDEPTPQAGVTVTITNSTGTVVATTATGTDGSYEFTGLPADDYVVTVVAPTDTTFTTPGAGNDDAVDSDVGQTSGTVTVTVAPGAEVTDVDGGLVPVEQDLAIDITTVATSVDVGDDIIFVASISNPGNVPIIGGVTVTIPLPADTTFVSASGDGWIVSVANGVLTATRQDPLGPGEVAPPLTLVVEPTRAGTVSVTGEVVSSSGVVETTQSNNVSSVPVQVLATPVTSVPNLAYTGSSLLLLLLIAGGLMLSGRTLTFIGGRHKEKNKPSSGPRI